MNVISFEQMGNAVSKPARAFRPFKRAVPRPELVGTGVFLLGLGLTYATLTGDTPSAVARWAAVGTGISLALSMLIELNRRWENMLRADIVALFALYFLIFVEFLFPQPRFDELVGTPQKVEAGIGVCLLAFAALGIGRHCVSKKVRTWHVLDTQIPLSIVTFMFWISFAIGYFHMLLAVNFNPVTMINDFFLPRFEVPWAREQYGDVKAMLYELGATLYLVPPLAGIILGRPRTRWDFNVILVLLGFLFTLFYGFTTGTRNVICAYIITFAVSYFYASSASKLKIAVLGAIAVGILGLSVVYGIRFRNGGLGNYLEGATDDREDVESGLYVDYDLYVISELVTIFPNYVDYIGWDGPQWLLVRPVPRFLWPGKPDGKSVAAENVLGVQGAVVTVSCTFVGESYMVAGLAGVIFTAFALGMLTRWWTKKVFSKHSDLGIMIYGSGFFAIAITMRSVYLLPVAMLPTIFAAVIGYWLTQKTAQLRKQAPRRLPQFQLDEART
jgi:hypothetical protein